MAISDANFFSSSVSKHASIITFTQFPSAASTIFTISFLQEIFFL